MKKTEQHFEITIKLDSDGESTIRRDINYCAFIRTPFSKSGNFVMMRAFIPTKTIDRLDSKIGSNQFPKVLFQLWVHGDNKVPSDFELIYQRELLLLMIKPDAPLTYQESRTHATLIMVHPIIYFLETTNVFNKLFHEKRAVQVLMAYEDWLKSTHGDIFKFNHVGIPRYANKFVYEQLLVKSINDLNVPNYLMHTYKVNNSIGYYFFDDFYLAKDSTKEIWCHHVNLMAPNMMKRIDVFNKGSKDRYPDVSLLTTNFLGTRPLTDFTKEFLDKKMFGHRPILNHREMYYEHKKNPGSASVPKKTPKPDKYVGLVSKGERGILFTPNGNMSKGSIGHSATYSRIYSPDNNSEGKARFDLGIKFFEMAQSIEFYEMQNCLPDFPQFGKKHRIHSKTHDATPINIVNIFIRKNIREHYLYHTAKCIFLKYTS